MVAELAAPCGGKYAERNPDTDTKNDRGSRQLNRGRKDTLDIAQHRQAGQQGIAQIAVHEIVQVVAKLHIQRAIQPHAFVYLHIGGMVRIRADNGQYRIERHHAADEESQCQQAQQR